MVGIVSYKERYSWLSLRGRQASNKHLLSNCRAGTLEPPIYEI